MQAIQTGDASAAAGKGALQFYNLGPQQMPQSPAHMAQLQRAAGGLVMPCLHRTCSAAYAAQAATSMPPRLTAAIAISHSLEQQATLSLADAPVVHAYKHALQCITANLPPERLTQEGIRVQHPLFRWATNSMDTAVTDFTALVSALTSTEPIVLKHNNTAEQRTTARDHEMDMPHKPPWRSRLTVK